MNPLLSAKGASSSDIDILQISLQKMLNEAVKEDATVPGAIIYIDAPAINFTSGIVSGHTDFKSGQRLLVSHPVRLASNTKTYVAAAVLRLWEEGRLELHDPINQYLLPESNKILNVGGYETDKITVMHLLTHTSGLFDYAESDPFDEAILANPQKRWSRNEQLKATVRWGKPLGQPGEGFSYSDTGYILLGEVLERITGKALPVAVRELLDFDALGINKTWWETLEPVPIGGMDRAHQYWEKLDTYNWDPSFDLYGSGGLVGPVDELSRFMMKLFSGEVFKKPDTLEVMITGSMPNESKTFSYGKLQKRNGYGMGIRTLMVGDMLAYEHSGAWGTTAAYFPELKASIAVVATQLWSDTKENILRKAVDLLHRKTRELSLSTISSQW